MKHTLGLFGTFLLTLGAAAQTPAPADTVAKLARSADAELERGIQELNGLRDAIANEKLPLARSLGVAEDELSGLRKEHDQVGRDIAALHLETAGLKSEMKARQDELDYVGNLLDEYARTFDQKINVCELQSFGEHIESAKAAGENPSLTQVEKFEKQVAFVNRTVDRLFDVIGGMRFPGVGIDLQGGVVDGQYTIFGPVALFGTPAAGASPAFAGVVVPQTGSSKPLIRPLEGELQAGLVSLVSSGSGALPLDPSRGGALKALVQKTNLIHIFEKGGPIMWPLLLASILALGAVIERLFFLANERRKRDPDAMERLFEEVEKGRIAEAIRIGKQSKDYVVRPLTYALEHAEKSLSNALVYAQAQELKRFRRGISVLDTVITLAPLLGLLGTVTGMMGSFSLIGGELSAPGAITGGIAEALIATAFGLGIAITALIPFNYLNTKLDEVTQDIDAAATQLELLVHPHKSDVLTPAAKPAPVAAPQPLPAGAN
ncbi:MAG: MotA/TolQ/ExbB proton channel family protein [Planctomycetes bacterium]|nr:MotA/TolQ/ExbB proton channel family protein [Planctomycetota bacterium]